jgi:hypothetical protein
VDVFRNGNSSANSTGSASSMRTRKLRDSLLRELQSSDGLFAAHGWE